METSQLRLTPSPSGLASMWPCSMCQRTVRGDMSNDLAATCVVTHPASAVASRSDATLSPRVLFSPTREILDHQDRGRKPLEANLVALSRDRLVCGLRGLSCASPGRRFSSELDLLVGGRDRWTGYPRHREVLCWRYTTASRRCTG